MLPNAKAVPHITTMHLLSALFQVTEELRAYDAIMKGASNPSTDALVYGTCRTAPVAKAIEKHGWDLSNQLFECISLGEERCNSKPYCAKTKLPNTSQTVCIPDMRGLDDKYVLADLTGTPYSKRLADIADKCGKINTASECKSTVLATGVEGH